MEQLEIISTKHYLRHHAYEVPWETVLRVIFTAKCRRKGKNIFEYKSESFYVLCSKDGNRLKVINAKKREK